MAVASCQVNVEFWPAGALDALGSHPDQDTPFTTSQLLHSSVSSQWVLSDLLDYQTCFQLVPAPGCGWKAVLMPLETPLGLRHLAREQNPFLALEAFPLLCPKCHL